MEDGKKLSGTNLHSSINIAKFWPIIRCISVTIPERPRPTAATRS